MDNNYMNTIKFLPHNQILLNNKVLLNRINYTKDSEKFYTINNYNYE